MKWGREKKGRKEIFEVIMTENLLKFTANTKPRIWESQRTLGRKNTKTLNLSIGGKTLPEPYLETLSIQNREEMIKKILENPKGE